MTRLLILLLGLLSVAAAEDLTTTDGKTYTGVTVTKVEQDGLRILHASGTAMVPFAKLPEDLQKKYSYDPAKAEAVAKETAAKLAESQRMAKEKREANEWHNKFQLDHEELDQLTLHYSSYEQLVREDRARSVKKNRTKTQIEASVALIAKGGQLIGSIQRPTSDEAAAHSFTVLVFDRDGNEIKTATRQYNSEVMKNSKGIWHKSISAFLLSPLQEGDRISIVDKLDGRHRNFTVKPKTPTPSPQAKP